MLKGFGLIRVTKLAILWLILVLGGTFILGFFIKYEISRELDYQRKYGDEWRSVYEHYHGSLAHAHAQLAIAIGALVAIFSILTWMVMRARRKHRPRAIHHGGMNGAPVSGIFRFVRMAFVGILFFLGGLLLIGRYVWDEVSMELRFRREYGSDWRAEYESLHGSLDHAHIRLAIAVGALVSVFGILVWIYARIRSKGQRRREKRSR